MTREDSHRAKQELKRNGWEFILSCMSDMGDKEPGKRYGSLFVRYDACIESGFQAVTKREFWLNKDTFRNIPR